jgi:hypothetical protein
MSKIITSGAALVAASVATGSASALDRLSRGEIAALPQDKVETIKRHCAEMFPDAFETRLFCEDSEFVALKKLIDRGSIKPKGDNL